MLEFVNTARCTKNGSSHNFKNISSYGWIATIANHLHFWELRTTLINSSFGRQLFVDVVITFFNNTIAFYFLHQISSHYVICINYFSGGKWIKYLLWNYLMKIVPYQDSIFGGSCTSKMVLTLSNRRSRKYSSFSKMVKSNLYLIQPGL